MVAAHLNQSQGSLMFYSTGLVYGFSLEMLPTCNINANRVHQVLDLAVGFKGHLLLPS